MQAHEDTFHALRRSPDGAMLARCGDDGTVMVWDAHRGELFKTLYRDWPYERLNISGVSGLNEAQEQSLMMLGTVE